MIALEVWGADADQLVSTAIRAEDLGFAAVYYGESPPGGPNLECWTVLAALARLTSRIRLGPVIANALPTWRHPALLVHQALTVAALSGGRLDLRTGAGAAARFGRRWWEPHGVGYPAYDQRLTDLVALLDTLDRSRPGSVPVTIAATGSRAMALAAGRADCWETSFATPVELAGRYREMHRMSAGRPIVCSLEIDGFVASTPARVDRLLARVRSDRADEDLEPVLARALVGTPADVEVRLAELARAGADQLVVALHDPHDPDALEALATAVSRATGR
ncbi:MAG: LLM class flavin-dependent oxidoreductase [Acidimicrobiia bacterium]|nr:LLM class flavin-dependent oxidoreductase [Acidimicrobiia bacterium]